MALLEDRNKDRYARTVVDSARRAARRSSLVVSRLRKGAEPDRVRADRLVLMYERLRSRCADNAVIEGRRELPTIAQIAAVEDAVLQTRAQDIFLRTLVNDGDPEAAAVMLVRELLRGGAVGRARTVAQAYRLQPGTRSAGDIGEALIALFDRMPERAWTLLVTHSLDRVLRLAPTEYFRTGFQVSPHTARSVLDAVLREARDVHADAAGWLDIARTSFCAGAEALSARALAHAEERISGLVDTRRARRIRAEITWLRSWYGRAERAADVLAPAAGEIPFAVLDYKQPDRARSSTNLGDSIQTLAALAQLARRRGLRLTGDRHLAEFTARLRSRVLPERIVDGEDAALRLYRVDRDASSYAVVPEGTWMIAFGWLMHSMFDMRYDLPFNPRLRPIFISVHLNTPELLTEQVVDYLRRYGPVGCRDWNTVHLLRAAGVPAFFSGCLTTTIDTVIPPVPGTLPAGTLYVDAPAAGPGDAFAQEFAAVRDRELSENLADALTRVQGYRDSYQQIITTRLHCYLPARSIGTKVSFRPKNPANARFDGLAGITDEAFNEIRAGILDKLDAVLGAITAGKDEDEVYAVWRAVCASDVAAANARGDDAGEIAEPQIDVAAACRAIRARSVTVERSLVGPDGPEICVEFSLDGNLKHQLAVVLHSVVSTASRPIRAFILCRDHGPDDFARMAALFPGVSFVWLPTDGVDYGKITGMIGHITVATMDRLLLPELLPDVTRIIHHDVDALCLSDLAELYDVDLGNNPIAARTSPHPNYRSGFVEFIRSSSRLRTNPELASEFIRRTHTRHAFDFEIFNAGIMVLDLQQMRNERFCRLFLPYAERFGLNDQAVLNAYAGARRVELDAGWNWHPRLELADHPKIAHWAGPLKPWGRAWVNGKDLWQRAEAELAARRRESGSPAHIA